MLFIYCVIRRLADRRDTNGKSLILKEHCRLASEMFVLHFLGQRALH